MNHEARQATDREPDSRWRLLAIALPIGVWFNTAAGGGGDLSQYVLTLMGWMVAPTPVQRQAARLIAHLLVPGVLAFLALNFTPLGHWLVPNRLALLSLLAADGLLIAVALAGLYLASIDEPPFLRGIASEVVGALLTGTVVIGLLSLVLSTIWYRLLNARPRVVAFCQSLLQRV